jgi:hypothetical protein
MYAVLYSDAATLARLLKLGADPNKRNDANATALMCAAMALSEARGLGQVLPERFCANSLHASAV